VVEVEWSRPQLFKPLYIEEIRDGNLSNEEFERIRNNTKDVDGEDIEKNYQYTYEIEKVLEKAIKKEYGK
jgi:cell division protein FtsI/penicillin-binding protein 2